MPLGEHAAVALDRDQANYLGNVMRLQVGDAALLFDGTSGEWLARVTDAVPTLTGHPATSLADLLRRRRDR